MSFIEKLLAASRKNNSLLCVGLDPDPSRMPISDVAEFNKGIIDATADLVCAYKPNFGFYEALGMDGLRALESTLECVPPDVPVIADAKRGDIGNTARAYARAIFDVWRFDAVTVNPYLGGDSLEPFLEYDDRGVFVLCRTSNQGARDFQDLVSSDADGEGRPLFLAVAQRANEWNKRGNVGLVVGATYPEELKQVREICTDMPILIPGVGAQGGDLAAAIRFGTDATGNRAIINSSRGIIYAGEGNDFADASRRAALALRDDINRHRVDFG
jgi:orotidine-5'-phosphate decarboxylase